MARIVSRFVALLLALMTVAAGVLLLAEFFDPTICRVMERCMCRSHAGLSRRPITDGKNFRSLSPKKPRFPRIGAILLKHS